MLMAQAIGYPTQQIKNCSHFQRTHTFIVETWEALYRTMLMAFAKDPEGTTISSVLQKVGKSLTEAKKDWKYQVLPKPTRTWQFGIYERQV